MNESDIQKHYEFLAHKHETEIRLISPEKKVTSCFVHNLQELLDLCKEHSGKSHIYIGINERKKRGTKSEDIENIQNFVLDIDSKGNFVLAQETALKIQKEATEQGFKEPLLICSGNGFHLYFALSPIPNTEENREKLKAFGNKLKKKYEQEGFEIDSAVFEPARVMRFAGTMNIKPEVNAPCFIVNPDCKRQEDALLTEQLLAIKPEGALIVGNLETSLSELIEKDEEIKRLFSGNIKGFASRSEAEESLVCRLNSAGLDKGQIFKVMASCRIGKWQETNVQYRELTYKKALEIINKQRFNSFNKNPYKKFHYSTQHLPFFEDMNVLFSLYGKPYLPIKKARWYQIIGGTLQKKIRLGERDTDTRINCIYPLPTEAGKNNLIYLAKDIVKKVSKGEHSFSIEEPISYHPEQLIGKYIEREIPNPAYLSGEVSKPKKIKTRIENRGYFNSDFIEFDEANSLIAQNDEQTKQAREYISKALNPIGRNEVTKKLIDDLPTEKVSYCPKCTFTLYFQPKKIPEELLLQGFLRRFLIPVGKIEPFLNYGTLEDFKRKTSTQEHSKQTYEEKLVEYLNNLYISFKDREFIIGEEANEKINFYLDFLIAQGQVHSEKISNLTKLIKWTIQDYLIKMSCILAGSYNQNIVSGDFVALAFMDLTELLQSTFDFLKEWSIGTFDYGTGWQGANYKEKTCLEYLYNLKCFSLESSNISIADFEAVIMNVYNVRESMARKIFTDFKKKEWILSKQSGSYDSRVWLNFLPQTENLTFQGDKGAKGVNLYESVFSAISSILGRVAPLSPLTPSGAKNDN